MTLELRQLAREIHQGNIDAGWWKQETVGFHPPKITTVRRNIGELLCLVHSEISEADEGIQDSLWDDKLPHRLMVEVELADTRIRVLDILGYYDHPCVSPNAVVLPEGRYWPEWCLLMHRTVSQAMEHFRKGHAVEGCDRLVDLLTMIDIIAQRRFLDVDGATAEKRAFNATRADHELENRAAVGGKQF